MYDGNSILSFLRDYERDRQVLGIQKGRFRNDPRAAINHEAPNSLRVKTKHRNETKARRASQSDWSLAGSLNPEQQPENRSIHRGLIPI